MIPDNICLQPRLVSMKIGLCVGGDHNHPKPA